MIMKHIGCGFYEIATADAERLAKESAHGKLPSDGHEIRVTLADGRTPWLTRSLTGHGRQVWAIRFVPKVSPLALATKP